MNNNKTNKVLTASFIAICLIVSAACTERIQPKDTANEQEPKQLQKQQYESLPQSSFEGIAFPANKEQAKLAGFTNCSAISENEYSCSLNRKLKFEGYEFESVYVLLNRYNNLVDFDKTGELGYSESKLVEASSPTDEYTYRSIHLLTKLKTDASCIKEHTKVSKTFASSGCSTGQLFLSALENKGWLIKCEGAGIKRCAYYTKDGSYRIVNHGMVQMSLPPETNIAVQLHLELEPLSPSSYGVAYKAVNAENTLAKQSEFKEQDFIKSMKN